MIYSKEELLKVWDDGVYKLATFPPESPLPHLSSAGIRSATFCPKCHRPVNALSKVNNIWACHVCNKSGSNSLPRKKRSSAIAYRMVNDLTDYLGEVSSEKLFDSSILQGFVKFAGLDTAPNNYVYFLTFIRAIVQKEMGALKVLNFLAKADEKVLELRGKYKFSLEEGNKKGGVNPIPTTPRPVEAPKGQSDTLVSGGAVSV